MSPSRIAVGRRRAVRAALALTAVTACLGAALAYAAAHPSGGRRELQRHRPVRAEKLLRPELLETPAGVTAASEPQFRFHVAPRGMAVAPVPAEPPIPETSSRRFQCRIDYGEWSGCRSPYRLVGLAPGSHRFAVRVFNRENRVGEAVGYEWRQAAPATITAMTTPPSPPGDLAAPKQFTIEALAEPEGLYPGFPPQSIPVRITNPNSVPIEVTALTVAIGAAPAGCTAENFELTPSSASQTKPVAVPAESSVELPSAGAEPPAIRMLNLPVDQDSCQEAQIPLVFSGEAQG